MDDLKTIVMRHVRRARDGATLKSICAELDVDRSGFYKKIRPGTAKGEFIDDVLKVLDHESIGITEDERLEITFAWFYIKAEAEGPMSAAWMIWSALGKELSGKKRGPVSKALIKWAAVPLPAIKSSRRGAKSAAAKKTKRKTKKKR